MTLSDDPKHFPENPESLPHIPEGVPPGHPLRRLFRSATRWAFSKYQGLYDPAVEDHISDGVLSEFVHTDRIHRLRDKEGRPLRDLAEIALEGRLSSRVSGLERDLEVHQHAGDYALFMAGIFPESLETKKVRPEDPLLAYVGSLLVAIYRPMDYYIVEGRSAYSHVARLYRGLNPTRAGLFHRLSHRFEEYLDLMRLIREYLGSDPHFKESQDVIH